MQWLEVIGGLVVVTLMAVGVWRSVAFLIRAYLSTTSTGEAHEHDTGEKVTRDGGTDAAAE